MVRPQKPYGLLGTGEIRWRARPDITAPVDWGVKHQVIYLLTFHVLMQKGALMISNLALLLVVFRVTALQAWQWKG